MVAPTIYRSDDASAPVLSYGAGTLIAVLDACLVSGYGAKPAAGWTKEYSGTNKAAYKMGAGGTARRMFLRVEDSAAYYGLIRGYDDMTDVDTGTEPFPTVAQMASGAYVNKSQTAVGTTRTWMVIATPTNFYFFGLTNESGSSSWSNGTNYGSGIFFGEYVSYMGGGFSHHVALIGGASAGSSALSGCMLGSISPPADLRMLTSHYCCRPSSNVAGAVQFGKVQYLPTHWLAAVGQANVMGRPGGGALAYPEPVSGKLFGSRIDIIQSTGARAGRLPGLWAPTNMVGNVLDTIEGSGAAAGRTLLCMDMLGCEYAGTANNATGRGFLDLTNLD